jgi:chromosome segregation ATPase
VEIQTLLETTAPLERESESDRSVIVQLKAEVATLESAIQSLSSDRESQKTEYSERESQFRELEAWTESAQQKIAEVLALKEDLEKLLGAETELSQNLRDEVERLKSDIAVESQKAPGQNEITGLPLIQEIQAAPSNDAEDFFGSGGGSSAGETEPEFGKEGTLQAAHDMPQDEEMDQHLEGTSTWRWV